MENISIHFLLHYLLDKVTFFRWKNNLKEMKWLSWGSKAAGCESPAFFALSRFPTQGRETLTWKRRQRGWREVLQAVPHLAPGRIPSGDGTWIGPSRADEISIGQVLACSLGLKFCLSLYSLSALLLI